MWCTSTRRSHAWYKFLVLASLVKLVQLTVSFHPSFTSKYKYVNDTRYFKTCFLQLHQTELSSYRRKIESTKNINIIQNSREKDRTRKVNRFYFEKFQKAKIETFFLLFPNSWSLSRLSFLCYGSCTHACKPQVLSKNQKEINTIPGNIRSVMARLPLRLNITTIMRWWKLQEARKIW